MAPQLLPRALAKTGDIDRVIQERVHARVFCTNAQAVKVALPRNNHTKRRRVHERQNKIDKTRGGNSGSDLKGCYFLATTTANCYDFYDKNNNLLASNICTTTSPLGFSFNNFEGLDWTFTNVLISADTASGDWENNENAQEEVGTWEAGTGEDEAAAAGR